MRTLRTAFVLVAVAAVAYAGFALAGGKGHQACMGKGDCPGYDLTSTTTFEGKIVGIEKETCKGCGMVHVDLVVKTKDDEKKVRLGPAWYIDNQEETLKKDDTIEVSASKVTFEDAPLFVAAKITKGDDVLILRDKNGLPMWQGWRRGKA